MPANAARRTGSERDAVIRWECHCQQPPVLLGTYDGTGRVNIKVRDRYWHLVGTVWTTCPKCGNEHTLNPPLPAGQAGDRNAAAK